MYEAHFGLTAKPFQLNPDPDFFFGSRGHKRAMAYLEYGLHQGEGFIVITGEVGAGKTTLLKGLLRRIPGDSFVPVQIVSTQVDSDDLLRLVAAAFGLDSGNNDKATLLTRLQRHFEELHALGRHALLIVDEAQNLSARAIEELRMLSNFQVGTRSLVQSFLVGQPEFREIMQRPEMRQLKQRVIASYHLGPLDAEETRHYIEHRLRHVGWNQRPGFEAEAFALIHAHTDGVPRRINTLCDRLLLAAFLGDKSTITVDDVRTVAQEQTDELGGKESSTPEDAVALQEHAIGDLASSNAATPEVFRRSARLYPPSSRDQLAQLEERIEMLEASNAMMFNLLRKVLRAMRQHSARSSSVSADASASPQSSSEQHSTVARTEAA
jgi:general secretion pathway protein A